MFVVHIKSFYAANGTKPNLKSPFAKSATVLTGFLHALFFLVFVLSGSANGETLTRLEAIASRYATMDDLLNDSRGLIEYREALKAYMGEGENFDPIFAEFTKQIRDASANIPGFTASAWRLNSNWRAQAFTIEGEFSGSGLETRRDAIANAVTKIKDEAKAQAGPNLTSGEAARIRADIEQLAADLKAEYGLLDKDALEKLSRREQAEYGAKLSGKRGLSKLADHPKMKQLSGYVTMQLMTRYERLYDALNSGDADVVANELKKLERASRFEAGIAELGIPVPKEILPYIEFHSPTREQVVADYEKGIASIKNFRHIADSRLPADVLARMQQLQGQGIAQEEMFAHLSPELQEKYRMWKQSQGEVNQKKRQFADAHGKENPFFFYELHEDPAKGTLRLKAQSGLELEFIPSPRPFHAFFAGRKKGECVGGASCEGLTPRRWARPSLDGARTLFTERGDGKMEGYVGLTPVIHEKT